MRKILLFLCWVLTASFILAAATPTPGVKKNRKFIKPENPVIRITATQINNISMWWVTVEKGSLELQNHDFMKQGAARPLQESDIVWKIGQIVVIGEDGVYAGGKKWAAGVKLFVDERGRFLPISTRPTGSATR